MSFVDIAVFRAERFAIEREVESGRTFVSFPVFNGLAEYSEFYEISQAELDAFTRDEPLLKAFVQECRERKHDNRLLFKPGAIRGDP